VINPGNRIDNQEFYQLLDENGIAENIHLFNEKAQGVGGLL